MFEVFELLCKKFGSSKKVWIRYGSALLSRSKVNEAKELLKRALTRFYFTFEVLFVAVSNSAPFRLPKRKHVAAISKFAQLEFKVGDPERGRTIFEVTMECCEPKAIFYTTFLTIAGNSKQLSEAGGHLVRLFGS
jgi:rRNA biogenesis protein RRP5